MTKGHDDIVGLVPLYDVFYEHLPNHRSDKRENGISMHKIAMDIDLTVQAIHHWFKPKVARTGAVHYLPVMWMEPLINLEGSTLTEEILRPYTLLG